MKQAFLDEDLKKKYNFSSANSINIARLLPQSFYYFEGYKQVQERTVPIVYVVPSGNFGNLTAGMLAKKMGLPIHSFVAATNINKTVPEYLGTGNYVARPSIATISNAMDVGDPSNFPRMKALYEKDSEGSTWNSMKKDLIGMTYNDLTNAAAIKEIKENHDYIADPHGALGFIASKQYLIEQPDHQTIFLETAHPGKFLDVMKDTVGSITIPHALQNFDTKEGKSSSLGKEYKLFKDYLLDR